MSQYFFKMSQAEKNSILDKHKTIYDGYVTEYGQQSNTQPLYVQDYANDKEGMVVSNKGVVKPYTNIGINESHDGLDMIGDGSDDLKNGTVDLDDISGYPSPNEDEFDYISLGMLDDTELEEGFDDFDIKRKRGGIDYNEKEFPGKNKFEVDIEDLNFGDFLEPKRDDSNELDFDYEEVDEEHGTFDHMSDEYGDDDLNYGSTKRNYHDIDDIMPIIPDFEDEIDEDILPDFMEKLNESLDMFKRFKKYN